ncbi:MAG TPA: hypothetical protein VK616_08760, partial [Flavitalea sp.]|nr:hypothetical protein [Flavitalea sp.]
MNTGKLICLRLMLDYFAAVTYCIDNMTGLRCFNEFSRHTLPELGDVPTCLYDNRGRKEFRER